ncbi:hypothetical protein J2X69_005141, partial [Algoriphagus sp. 4150]|uniref:condensation domain-containing protein n=1 Tax=Algoriphagus sp. 4150 TaxID=2817756 RepID=UPI0028548668
MKNKITNIYPANSLQQGFIYHALTQQDDDTYILQQVFDYHEELKVDLYLKAWELCIAQYPILRTAFNWKEQVVQIIYQYGRVEFEITDLSNFSDQQAREFRIKTILKTERKKKFDLSKPSLFRLQIIKQSENWYTVVKTEHHVIAEGWSALVLLQRLHQYYQLLLLGKNVPVYEDRAYIKSQEYISANRSRLAVYWKNKIAEVESINDISALLNKPIDIENYKWVARPATQLLIINYDLYDKLKSFCQREAITINVVIQFVWHKLLQVYSGNYQSIVGTVVSGRDLPIEGIEESVGLYINTLPLILNWSNNGTIRYQLGELHRLLSELNRHSFADIVRLQKNGKQLFHSLLIFENYPWLRKENGDGLRVVIREVADKVDYPFGVFVYQHVDSLTIKLRYDGYYLNEEKARAHMGMLDLLLKEVLAHPEKPHCELSLLHGDEYNRVVYDWNATDREYERSATICELFERQVERTPDG